MVVEESPQSKKFVLFKVLPPLKIYALRGREKVEVSQGSWRSRKVGETGYSLSKNLNHLRAGDGGMVQRKPLHKAREKEQELTSITRAASLALVGVGGRGRNRGNMSAALPQDSGASERCSGRRHPRAQAHSRSPARRHRLTS